jgi:Zn-dependent protease
MSELPFPILMRDAVMYMVALILSICVHEFGHAWLADKLGDPLPKAQGRVTMNPAAHVDPLGTLLFPLVGFFMRGMGGPMMLGWGKPVRVSLSARHMSRRFSTQTSHMFIALAGPMMNVLFALVLSGVYVALWRFGGDSAHELAQPVLSIVGMNLGLACFNLIPCPPLDGGAVLRGILPRSLEFISDTLEQYGFIIFFALLATRALTYIMIPATNLIAWWQLSLMAFAVRP